MPRIDLQSTFALQQLGPRDPTATLTAASFRKCVGTLAGPMRVLVAAAESEVDVRATGADAGRCAEALRIGLASADDASSFVTDHALLRRLQVLYAGLRVVRVPWLFDVACGAVLQQRVSFAEAARGWHRLAIRFGERDDERRAFPVARVLASLAAYEFPALGIDSKRGRCLQAIARREAATGFLSSDLDVPTLRKQLRAIPGVGPWTTEMILGFGAGDADALPTGDLHLPRLVVGAFGATPYTDARMVELLEPFRGHRFLVVRLLMAHAMRKPAR